jgi:hypothetical protein
MNTSNAFRDAVLATDVGLLRAGRDDEALRIASSGNLAVQYAPFDYVNHAAKIVIVGITPGRTQAANAVEALQRDYARCRDWEHALEAAKVYASFSGPMRANLVAMLDYVGVHRLIGGGSTLDLFHGRASLAHFTSALRYPVFVNGKDYSGAPSMVRNAWLKAMVERWFGDEAKSLRHAVFVPLGPKVEEALTYLAGKGIISRDRIIAGLPHPSGANAERIAYFLGRKTRDALSVKTNPVTLDEARDRLLNQVSGLRM